jgi:hypothetical protein
VQCFVGAFRRAGLTRTGPMIRIKRNQKISGRFQDFSGNPSVGWVVI